MNRIHSLIRANKGKGEFRAEGNTLYVYDVIVASDADAEWFGGVSSESFVKALRGMSGDVTIRVNSPGGDVFGGRAMASAIKEYQGSVSVHVDGFAASAASFLTAAADRVVMAEGSFQMIHNAWTLALGNKSDMLATAELLEKIDASIADSYAGAAKRRGKEYKSEDFAAAMDAETWLTASEAIDMGLADEVTEGAVKNRWDLSAYDKAPAVEPEAEPEQTLSNEIVRKRHADTARARARQTA